MIYTSYFAKLNKLPENVIPISICGRAPEWYTGLQYKKLAPKYEFFMKWKETGDNDYYIRCFNEQVLDTLRADIVLSELQLKLPYDVREEMQCPVHRDSLYHIALICYEQPGDFCHRHLVADWLCKNGIECTELDI